MKMQIMRDGYGNLIVSDAEWAVIDGESTKIHVTELARGAMTISVPYNVLPEWENKDGMNVITFRKVGPKVPQTGTPITQGR